MSQFPRIVLTGVVLLGGVAFAGGCQRSGSADRTGDDMSMRGEVAMTTGRFDQAYEATRDTEWVSSTAADAERGTLMTGDRVMFDRAPGTADWQQARTMSGRTVYVHPGDFRRAQ